MLKAAGELDRGDAVLDAQDRHGRSWKQRQRSRAPAGGAAIATLLLGGGRTSATGAMVWRDVDLANGRSRYLDDPVFVTSSGKPRSRHNLRHDVVDAVMKPANRLVEERGLQPLPLGITPHKLRHTFASTLVAIGRDPTYVMQQLGHTDPAYTLRVYAHTMRRSEEERERLKALVQGHIWAANGQREPAPDQPTHRATDS